MEEEHDETVSLTGSVSLAGSSSLSITESAIERSYHDPLDESLFFGYSGPPVRPRKKTIPPPTSPMSHSKSAPTFAANDPAKELAELIKCPHTYVRRRIKAQVEDILWINQVQQLYKEMQEEQSVVGFEMHRCPVCTLPFGSCVHNEEWHALKNPLFKV